MASVTVLLVEDAKNVRNAMKVCLEAAGYRVVEAEDGLSAVQFAFSETPDVILLDILIPKMNGYLVCEALRQDDRTRGIPVVFVTAKAQEEDLKRAESLGAAFLAKPFQPQDLLREVQRAVSSGHDETLQDDRVRRDDEAPGDVAPRA